MTRDLFENPASLPQGSQGPLAHRIRPEQVDLVLGLPLALKKWIELDQIPSIILWGPPGSGKTTIATIIAKNTQAQFLSLSAVQSGVADIRQKIEQAKLVLPRKTILFIDEIHRFSKSQQDALLPHVESGLITLLGATSENPSYEVNSALNSRCRIIQLKSHTPESLKVILQKALHHPTLGLQSPLTLTEEALDWLVQEAQGDARRALNYLESLDLLYRKKLNAGLQPLQTTDGRVTLTLDQIKEDIHQLSEVALYRYDKKSSQHYDHISALIKSMRAENPHVAQYYLARMIEGGEDPVFIARRLIIFASEDIGNADPRALTLAVSAKDAVETIGFPEGRICLSQVVNYLACAPKSRASYDSIEAALKCVRETAHIAASPLLAREGRLPESLRDLVFYEPNDQGLEKVIQQKLKGRK
jgi:putative ATPase